MWEGCEKADAVDGAKILANTLALLLTLLLEVDELLVVVKHVTSDVCCKAPVGFSSISGL